MLFFDCTQTGTFFWKTSSKSVTTIIVQSPSEMSINLQYTGDTLYVPVAMNPPVNGLKNPDAGSSGGKTR
jgi:hypothetical protein